MPDALSLSITARPTAARVAVEGEVDVTSAPELVEAITGIGAQFDRIEFDLSGVTFMDVSGLRAFEQACDEADRLGFSYRIVALSQAVSRLFDMTGQRALLSCN